MTNRQVLFNLTSAVTDILISLKRSEFGRSDIKSVCVDLDRLATAVRTEMERIKRARIKSDGQGDG